MTRSTRRFFLVLHTVHELAAGMLATGDLMKKSRESLYRILAHSQREMDSFGPLTTADKDHFRRIAAKLREAWAGEDAPVSRPAFVSIGLTLLADHRANLPKGATRTRKACARLEGLLMTLYLHFDPDLADLDAMRQGETVAREFQVVTMAA